MKYKVGDKVRIVDTKGASPHWNWSGMMDKWLGKTMTIREVKSNSYKMVEDNGERFDRAGWSWFEEMIAGPACEQKIVITSDGVTTLARLYEGSNVVKSAEAKCSPDDEFKFETGAKLAMERLYAPERKFKIGDRVKNPSNGTGTIIYIDDDDTYAVEFDKRFGGHTCGGRGKNGHCYWCDDDMLEAYVAPKFKKGDWVRITGKPTTAEDGIVHHYDIGDVVKIHSIDSDGNYYCERPYDNFEQFVSPEDVESPKK